MSVDYKEGCRQIYGICIPQACLHTLGEQAKRETPWCPLGNSFGWGSWPQLHVTFKVLRLEMFQRAWGMAQQLETLALQA